MSDLFKTKTDDKGTTETGNNHYDRLLERRKSLKKEDLYMKDLFEDYLQEIKNDTIEVSEEINEQYQEVKIEDQRFKEGKTYTYDEAVAATTEYFKGVVT